MSVGIPAACAILLIAACALSWALAADARAMVRPDIRFAAVLLAALGCADALAALMPNLGAMAMAAALLVVPLAAAALALAAIAALGHAPSRLTATSALMLGCIAGLLSAATGLAVPAVAATAASALVMLFAAPRRRSGMAMGLKTAAAALAFLGGGLCLIDEAGSAAALFFAAGLVGLARGLSASKTAVEDDGERKISIPVGPTR